MREYNVSNGRRDVTKTWGLIGYGTIGKELARQLGQARVAQRLGLRPKPTFIMRSSGMMGSDAITPSGLSSLKELDPLPDVVFVALPSTNDGKLAYTLISHVLEKGKTAVTAEKGAVANYFGLLKHASDDFKRLGISATVGGGTRVMTLAREYCHDTDNVSQLHLSLNGTLTAIMSSIAPPGSSGKSLGYAVYEAVQLGYAEPGADSSFEVIRSEAEADIPKKTAIFLNSTGLTKRPIDWRKLQFNLKDAEIAQVVEESKVRRFIVSIYPRNGQDKHAVRPEKDIIGGFSVNYENWHITGGFQNVERNPLFSHLSSLTGPGNGMVVGLGPDETDGIYAVTGPGAGPRPTVNTMLDDFLRISAQ